ncbi:MAG: hypothetical protein RIR18_2371 [Pseudomonadota bacterium]|jgi:hypothetical protein
MLREQQSVAKISAAEAPWIFLSVAPRDGGDAALAAGVLGELLNTGQARSEGLGSQSLVGEENPLNQWVVLMYMPN